MKSVIAALFLLITLIMASTVKAETVVVPPDIAEIKKSGQLVVSMTSFDNLPFYGGPADNVIGLDADIARKVAQLLGVKVVFRRDAATFQDTVEQVRRGEANAAISKLSITPPRLATVRFSDPYVRLHQALLVNRLWLSQNEQGRQTPDVIRNLTGSIGFIKDTAYETFAKISFPNAVYSPRNTWNNVLEDVISGKVAVAYRDEFEIKKIALERPESSINTKAITLTDSTDYIAAVVDFRSTQLLEVINFVIRNDFNNINVKKLVDMYQAQQKGAKK